MASENGGQFMFQTADFVLLGIISAVSVFIGIYHAFTGGRQKTTSEYLLGNGHMQVIPVAVSLLVSFQSAVLMIGFPAEMYVYGTMLWLFVLTAISANILSAILLVPLFQPLKLVSVYEYLELRFKSRFVRLFGSVLGICVTTWYSGVVLYGPAITLEAVTGTPTWLSIIIMAAAGILYTSIGGYKAVIWTDVFQFLVMISGMVAIIVKGVIDVGGISRMWNICETGGRINFFNFDPDPTVRHTFWCLILGGTVRKFGYNLGQQAIQRMSSMDTIRKGQKIVLLAIPGFVTFGTLACLEGLLAYAYFAEIGCDPLEAKMIKTNQVFPYFVMSLFHSYPGLPGVFLSSVFSASLSTLSSNLNSISAMISTDFIQPYFPKLNDLKTTIIAKLTVVVFGLIAVGVSFLAAMTKGPLYQVSSILLSSFDAPLTGIFLLGALMPSTTAKGAMGGAMCGFGLTLWISMGGAFSDGIPQTPRLPSPGIDHCPNTNVTSLMLQTVSQANITNSTSDIYSSPLVKLYSLSYMWLSTVGILTTVIIGYILSHVTGANKPGDVDPRFLIPVCDKLCCCLPESVRERFRPSDLKVELNGTEKCLTESKQKPEIQGVKFETNNEECNAQLVACTKL
ncbi:sodium-coupled monocarboxylate transporter 1-like [Liolophura sinensis]|uniref:sodium-coupled monocarboxylate transporter 1-like n=1 Tax=Liolophura sinensis TaxID=3198878 RepID=UPI003158986B